MGAELDLRSGEVTENEFTVKDSGARQQFGTGAQRDTQAGKPRYDLIPIQPLFRVANLYGKGAEKYNEHNWRDGIPMSRCYASAYRHLMQWAGGDRDEDHLAAVIFNCMCIMHFEDCGPKNTNDMAIIRGARPSDVEPLIMSE